MAKLGYTWYPKDWGNSEKVFELTLIERGLYRELIDIAMLNDNKTEINLKVWSRKYACSVDELEGILITLKDLDLIEVNDKMLFIPSCEARLNLVRGGRSGGKKSKPIVKPTPKPIESLEEKKEKPIAKQIEKKRKETKLKEIPTVEEFCEYALFKKSNLCKESLTFKYQSWVDNGWKNGNDKPIKNWKTTLLNTIPYIKTNKEADSFTSQLRPAVKDLKSLYE